MDRLLERDMVVRIISVLLAVVIWAQVSSDQNATKTRRLEVPLTQVGLNAGLQVTAIPSTVTLELQGVGRQIDDLKPADVKALVDLSGLKEPGTFEVPLTVSPPTGSHITVSSGPGPVRVTIEQRLQVRKRPEISPVAPVLDGDRRIVLSQPAQDVLISGLSSQMIRVDRVVGEVPLESVTGSGDRTIALKAVDETGQEVKGVIITPGQVAVTVTVTQLPPGRLVSVKPQWQGRLSDAFSFSADVTPKSVRVRGPIDQQASWTEVLTEPIALAGRSQSFVVEAKLVKPDGAQFLDQDTVTVTVTLGEARDQKVVKNVPLRVTGLGPGLGATLSVTEVQVTASGPRRLVALLDSSKVGATLDVEGLQAGDHRLKVTVQGTPGLDTAVSPDIVGVSLTPAEKRG